MPTIHLTIKGKVQSVFYRATAKEVAEEIGVTGWVKNTKDGSVEIVATGNSGQLQKLIQWCSVGPAQATVTGVAVNEIKEENFEGFQIIRKW
jgi:acylphosphatase